MIKVLLVDDEDFIRQGMRLTIPWEEHGLEIAGEANNGAEALRLAVQTNAEIVIADIQMPVMGGLELARALGSLLPRTKVIILTAYGNTENLTSAIDVKVSAFLLKSADSSKILETVLNVKTELEAEKKQYSQLEKMKGLFDENRHLIKATLFLRFMENQISFSHFSKKAEKLGLSIDSSSYALAMIKCDYVDEMRTLAQLQHYFSAYQPFTFFIRDQIAVIVLDTSQTKLEKQDMEQLLPSLMPLAFGNFITVMHHLSSFEDIPMAYSILDQTLEDCFWNTGQPYLLFSSSDTWTRADIADTYPYERSVISAVINRNTSEIKHAFFSYYEYASQNKIPRKQYIASMMRLVVLIGAASGENISISEIEKIIFELETPSEILELTMSLSLPDTAAGSEASTMEPILQYIRLHCLEPLYLEDVAKAVYLSPGYISRIFKAHTGLSFKEYVHYLRIEEAKKLISTTSLKYYEIAERVGYKNYKYFSSYFSKIAGCSAKEYRIAYRIKDA